MTFLEPVRLWLLVVPGALLVLALVLRARRNRVAARFTNLELLDQIAPERPGWRRTVVTLAVIASLALLAVASARPFGTVAVPREQATLILAVDVSLSMQATDVEPSRLAIAQQAASEFVALAPAELEIGLVAFAGNSVATLPPTLDRDRVTAAIEGLELAEGTAIGEGLFSALGLIESAALATEADEPPPAAVVILSDGETTMGRPDLLAAEAAAADGVPVWTISFGTQFGEVVIEGETYPVPVNEGALREVAAVTGGEFFETASQDEVRSVFESVGSEVAFDEEQREIADRFVLAALITLALAATISLLWFDRMT